MRRSTSEKRTRAVSFHRFFTSVRICFLSSPASGILRPSFHHQEAPMLTISGKAIGRKKPLFEDYSVPPPSGVASGQPITLRDLIGHVVRNEVAAFKQRQAERRLLKALTAKEITEGLTAGKVQAGGSELDQAVDPEQAVATAVEAFGDGLYFVVIDEQEIRELDKPVALTESSRLTFIRLTMLAGG
jgi:hypothetical protein